MAWLDRFKRWLFPPPPHKCGHFSWHPTYGIKECGECRKKFWIKDGSPVYPETKNRVRFK